mmetsp:Transcript_47148/g.78253  ORF Transcript_47148/g.78253 Transcript_47148/m.78253 type:complete len:374 (-) Transcript_47148:35-1156(-)|eukprot:CAMPEP_0202718716 /NCGR_PEP_ID=MMETSP1385-20130828/124733_1 /ASSEMBLY_ACC=CAM_ASM_000861 /TAXON_ID=933848 /ORGANISM="Elphidium margaritaceum" /LENGTH=373 /DNA_ID=CAMNT_0049381563 /DNA_START=15 /DNA_END=1136 /DNA_ORIENTATION=-
MSKSNSTSTKSKTKKLNDGRNDQLKKIKESSASMYALENELEVFGFEIPSFIRNNYTVLFITLASCHIVASVVFAFLQEKVTHIEGFKYSNFMTVIETLTLAVCAFLEISLSGGKEGSISAPNAPIFSYVILSVCTFGGMYCTNSGLKYISYPTRIIFKGAKPVPTMIMEYFYVGKIFTSAEVVSVMILVLGIIIFSAADSLTSSKFGKSGTNPMMGYAFMCGGVIFDSFTSNFEKKNIFRKHKATHCEAMFFASLFGFGWSLLILLFTDPDMLFDGFYFFMQTPEAFLWLILSSIGAYMSVVFVLLLIKVYSTTYAECVKGVRKICSIMISYLLLGQNKVFGIYHLCGVTCFVASSATTVYSKAVQNAKKVA